MKSVNPPQLGHRVISGATDISKFTADGVLVIECCETEADRICATLRVLFGYKTLIEHAQNVDRAIAVFSERLPSLTFIGDIDTTGDPEPTLAAITQLRQAGSTGSIIVISNWLTQAYRARLFANGVIDAFHKDDLCSERVTDALRRAEVGK